MENPAEATQAADRLYAVAPQQFVAERNAAAAAARAAGDRETAAALGKLRRPTVAAWLVNLLALRRPELVSQLAELAGALQSAQQELDGARLRELSGQRRSTVSALVATARSLAVEEDPSLTETKLPLAEVETTLNAALADRELAETVRSGRLTKAGGYEGFGELPKARPPRAGLRLIPGGSADAEPPAAESSEETREAAAAELAEARSAATAASAELDRAAATQEQAKRELAEVDAAIAELTERRTAAAARLAEAEATSMAARRKVVAARRRAGEAEAAAEALAETDRPA